RFSGPPPPCAYPCPEDGQPCGPLLRLPVLPASVVERLAEQAACPWCPRRLRRLGEGLPPLRTHQTRGPPPAPPPPPRPRGAPRPRPGPPRGGGHPPGHPPPLPLRAAVPRLASRAQGVRAALPLGRPAQDPEDGEQAGRQPVAPGAGRRRAAARADRVGHGDPL